MDKAEIIKQMSDILVPQNYRKRGAAFFRIQGDGVIVVIHVCYERGYSAPGYKHFTIRFNLQSMYDDLRPQHFTASGCINSYEIVNFIGERDALKFYEEGEEDYGWEKLPDDCFMEIPPKKQLQILQEKAVPYFDTVMTQEKLMEARYSLDDIMWGKPDPLDLWKYEPLMYLYRYEEARKIILNYLKNWKIPVEHHYDLEYLLNRGESLPDKNTLSMFHKLLLLTSSDRSQIEQYLMENYNKNCYIAGSVMKTWKR